MSNEIRKKLIEERSGLLKELASLQGILHGSLVERYTVCSRPNCKCHQGDRHGPMRCLVVNVNGKQRQKYIPNKKVGEAMSGLKQYRRLQEIISRITMLNLQLFKEDKND